MLEVARYRIAYSQKVVVAGDLNGDNWNWTKHRMHIKVAIWEAAMENELKELQWRQTYVDMQFHILEESTYDVLRGFKLTVDSIS